MASRKREPWGVAGACGILLAALGSLSAGCEQPSAAPKEDPCAKSCSMYAKCRLDLHEHTIRTVLEGSSDDVKKTAIGFAAEDMKALDARCRKVCGASAESTQKIGRCDQSSCVQLFSCMGNAVPEDPNAEAGPHSCVVEAQSLCVEYTGAGLKTSNVKPACRALFEGQYEKAKCPKTDLAGSCEVGKGHLGERTSYYYSTGKKPNTAESAKEACVGDFKPAGEAEPGVTPETAATTTPTVGIEKPSATP